MGVPFFFYWLAQKYMAIVEPREGMHIDNVYLDMNGIVHPECHPEDGSPQPKTEQEMFERIARRIDFLVSKLKPRKNIVLAFDGVAPRAKMNQQRSRRFKSVMDTEELADSLLSTKDVLAKLDVIDDNMKMFLPTDQRIKKWDHNVITPGTRFMDDLANFLRQHIASRVEKSNPATGWHSGLTVIFSDSNVPGEGEHKILDYIRSNREIAPREYTHCIVGEDADLIFLALATHEPNFRILRSFRKSSQISYEKLARDALFLESKDKIFQVQETVKQTHDFVNIDILREYLAHEFDFPVESASALRSPNPKDYDMRFENLIDDFVCLSFMVGNDFLPRLATLDIRDGAFDILLECYRKSIAKNGEKGNITSKGRISKVGLTNFLKEIENLEPSLAVRQATIRNLVTPKYLQHCRDYPNCKHGDACRYIHGSSVPSDKKHLKRIYDYWMESGAGQKWDNRLTEPASPLITDDKKSAIPSNRSPISNNTNLTIEGLLPSQLETLKNAAKMLGLRTWINHRDYSPSHNSWAASKQSQAVWSFLGRVPPNNSELGSIEIKRPSTFAEQRRALVESMSTVLAYKMNNVPIPWTGIHDKLPASETKDINGSEFKMGAAIQGKEIDDITSDIWLNHKKEYYIAKLGVEEAKVKVSVEDLCKNYIHCMQYVMTYYVRGGVSWSWYFPYHYGPFAADMLKTLQSMDDKEFSNTIWPFSSQLDNSKPLSPIEQLFSVLPPKSSHALPENLRPLMTSDNSPLRQYFPKLDEIKIDPNDQQMPWQHIALLPFVERAKISEQIDQARLKWSEHEKKRDQNNTHAEVYLSPRSPPSFLSRLNMEALAHKAEQAIEKPQNHIQKLLHPPKPVNHHFSELFHSKEHASVRPENLLTSHYLEKFGKYVPRTSVTELMSKVGDREKYELRKLTFWKMNAGKNVYDQKKANKGKDKFLNIRSKPGHVHQHLAAANNATNSQKELGRKGFATLASKSFRFFSTLIR